MLTFASFAARRRATFLAESPGTTNAEYDQGVPTEWVLDEWVEAIRDAIRLEHEVVPATVLDDLYRRIPHVAKDLAKYHRERSFPPGYLPPSAREANRARDAEGRAARRRGREGTKP